MRYLPLFCFAWASCQPMLTRRAPEFPKGLRWLNVSRPLQLHTDLKGRFVLLDFWTYCCINCMHVLPELKRLEKEFPALVVVGVHSAKFHNEQEEENVRAAILRYDIEHPVLLDEGYRVWQLYDAHAWPTFVLISPRGEVLWRSSGEGIYEALAPRLRDWVAAYQSSLSSEAPLPLRLEKQARATGLLAFPGKLALVQRSHQPKPYLYFTDSNYNRIIGITLGGEVVQVIGSGHEGAKDGDFSTAEFFRPQGLAYDAVQDALYVADTENHLIRRVDLRQGRVETVAGTGRQARRLLREGDGTNIPLNSPWDVALKGHTLYIAMAGFHQLWEMDTRTRRLRVIAGSGYENLIDGPALVAALAQPSGLTLSPEGKLYFADSETSSIRTLEGETVKTLVGKGLFDFGYQDGPASQALLQHPIGLTYYEGSLYIADTYNHAIRELNLQTGQVRTVAGTGQRGYQDGPATQARFNEPNDLLWANGFLYILDTNNHLLRRYDPRTHSVETVELYPMEKLAMAKPRTHSLFPDAVPLPALAVPEGHAFTVSPQLPAGYLLNEEAPIGIYIGEDFYPFRAPLPPLAQPTNAYLQLYVCEEKKTCSRCFRWVYGVELKPQAGVAAEVSFSVPAVPLRP